MIPTLPCALLAREDRLVECVQAFFAERASGPDRASYLAAQLARRDIRQNNEQPRRNTGSIGSLASRRAR
jgi:hypothetical protein